VSDPAALFAYGSLQVASIFHELTGLEASFEHAVLEGFERLCVAGESFPVIRPKEGALTRGRLYRALDAESWKLLDAFEGNDYERRHVRVRLPNGSEEAQAYVIRRESRLGLVAAPWSLARFCELHADAYLPACRRLRALSRRS